MFVVLQTVLLSFHCGMEGLTFGSNGNDVDQMGITYVDSNANSYFSKPSDDLYRFRGSFQSQNLPCHRFIVSGSILQVAVSVVVLSLVVQHGRLRVVEDRQTAR